MTADLQDVKSAHLRENEIFRDLNDKQIKDVAKMSAMTTCPRGRIFYRPEDKGEVLFILKQGSVALYRMSEDGRKLVTSTVRAGTVFGEMSLLGQQMADSYAESLEECTLCVMSREDVIRLIQKYPTIAVRVLDRLATRLREAEEHLADVVYRPVHARIASTLLNLASEDGTIRLTHQDIAEIVGTHRETVTRTVNQWRADGIVESERMLIRVIDQDRLRALATERRDV
jgi:CRP/FNR family transcriptional regulator, cyclic AMP receptor protein